MRSQFPLLRNNPGLSYLDSAATTHMPDYVIEEMAVFETMSRSNAHRGAYRLAEQATGQYEASRQEVAGFFGANLEGTVFVRGATEALNAAVFGWGEDNLRPGDLVVVETACHHAGIVPWQMLASKKDLRIAFVDVDDRGRMDEASWEGLLEEGPRAVSITGVSNVTGLANDLRALAEQAHSAGAMVFADCAQAAGHGRVNLAESGIDFAAVSAHKMYGPFGIGALLMSERALGSTRPLLGGGGAVESVDSSGFKLLDPPLSFEAGTPNISGAIGFAAACRYLRDAAFEGRMRLQISLRDETAKALSGMDGVRVLGDMASGESSIVSFFVDDVHPHDIASSLGDREVAVRAGHHCAMPLHRAMGVPASVRVSYGMYSHAGDVERLLDALEETLRRYR